MFTSSCKHNSKIEKMDGVNVLNITRQRGVYDYPKWSPDGKKIVVQFEENLWIIGLDDYSWNKITNEKIYRTQRPLIWDKPEEINYLNSDYKKDFGNNDAIHTINLANKTDTILLKSLPTINGLSWNPSIPSQLLVGVNESKSGFVLYLYDFKKNTRIELIKNGSDPKWSPDGKLIVYENRDGIYVYNVNTKITKLIYKRQKEGEFLESLTLSPNGKWIAYRGGPSKETNGIYILPIDGSSPPEHILNAGVAHLDWSPQGDKIVFTTINTPSASEIYIMDVPEKFQ